MEKRVGKRFDKTSKLKGQDEVKGVMTLSLHGNSLHTIAKRLELIPELDRNRFFLCIEKQNQTEIVAGNEPSLFRCN